MAGPGYDPAMGQTLKALTARLLLSFNINLAFMEGAMKSRALAEIKSAGQRLTVLLDFSLRHAKIRAPC